MAAAFATRDRFPHRAGRAATFLAITLGLLLSGV